MNTGSYACGNARSPNDTGLGGDGPGSVPVRLPSKKRAGTETGPCIKSPNGTFSASPDAPARLIRRQRAQRTTSCRALPVSLRLRTSLPPPSGTAPKGPCLHVLILSMPLPARGGRAVCGNSMSTLSGGPGEICRFLQEAGRRRSYFHHIIQKNRMNHFSSCALPDGYV